MLRGAAADFGGAPLGRGVTGLPFGAQSGHWPLGCGALLGSRAFPGGWLGGSAGPCSSALAGCLLLLSLLALEPPPVGEARAPLFIRGARLRAGFGAGALAAVLVCFLAFIFLARAVMMSPSPVPRGCCHRQAARVRRGQAALGSVGECSRQIAISFC